MLPTATSLLTLLCSLCLVGRGLASHHSHLHNYPSSVPQYEVRRDTHTNETVSRGRLRYINYSPAHGTFPALGDEQGERMVRFADFKRHLQCSSPEAELDGTRGGWSLLKMAPPTKQTVEQVCAWAESKCRPWVECRKKVKAFQGGEYDKRSATDVLDGAWGGFRGPVLLRVIDNELNYDWPWGTERFAKEEKRYAERMGNHYALLEIVLRVVSDIGDSVFFFGGERAFLQWNVPFPTFSFAPSISTGDMPFPFFESYAMEIANYVNAENAGHNFTDAFYRRSHPEWDKRIPKAAFFATFQSFRQVIFDSAALRPDLFDASYVAFPNPMEAWNPLSDEPLAKPPLPTQDATHNNRNDTEDVFPGKLHQAGFLKPIMKFGDWRHYIPERYKYVIVPVGSGDESTSGRLAGLLAHSGAVVLLQESRFAYHFSARLQPWVHYVPLSHSMADVIDKVEWLKHNDHLARRIVRNAQNFALSYLRLEDYLCYAAGSLRLLHDLEKTTDVLESFNATKIVRP